MTSPPHLARSASVNGGLPVLCKTPTAERRETFHPTKNRPWLQAAEDCSRLEVGKTGLVRHKAARSQADTHGWGKPEHSDQAQDTTSLHIGVCPDGNTPETSGTPGLVTNSEQPSANHRRQNGRSVVCPVSLLPFAVASPNPALPGGTNVKVPLPAAGCSQRGQDSFHRFRNARVRPSLRKPHVAQRSVDCQTSRLSEVRPGVVCSSSSEKAATVRAANSDTAQPCPPRLRPAAGVFCRLHSQVATRRIQ